VAFFSSELNRHLPRFVSWFPQPQAWKVDAFSFSWKNLAGFCFPPFNLIQFILSKLMREEADADLVTLFLPSQPWFPMAMELSCDAPQVFLPSPDLIIDLSTGRGSSPDAEQFNPTNRVAIIRRFFQEHGLLESAIKLILA
jgi:hypothetical protein